MSRSYTHPDAPRGAQSGIQPLFWKEPLILLGGSLPGEWGLPEHVGAGGVRAAGDCVRFLAQGSLGVTGAQPYPNLQGPHQPPAPQPPGASEGPAWLLSGFYPTPTPLPAPSKQVPPLPHIPSGTLHSALSHSLPWKGAHWGPDLSQAQVLWAPEAPVKWMRWQGSPSAGELDTSRIPPQSPLQPVYVCLSPGNFKFAFECVDCAVGTFSGGHEGRCKPWAE